MRLQRTLKQEVSFEGIGLHTGQYSKVRLKPAQRDTGIIFVKPDKEIIIRASMGSVIDTAFSTTLGYNGVKIRTVEHILAALSGLGIDNLIVEVNGPEIPILDGSSIELISIIFKGGIARQSKKRPCIRITNPVVFTDGHTKIAALPYNGRRITYRIHFNHHLLGEQRLSLELSEEIFVKEIAPARTFGFLKDVKYLEANGFVKGGSFENAIILSKDGVLNSSGLRFKDEFVRHKMLDLIGDFSLIGFPIYGHIVASKSGHTTNLKFLKKLLSYQDCWEIVSEIPQLS
ncbi:MAG: UDP-3-O-acyl-N-acetylglucosamine deacetylase [Thermodesulfovibrionales bacterium]|nr:UDP-3-O-acyl-N-acetylglucosamine deacetylase [Thermodesulfovibrionales bacterium]